jgi:hypothetical protein
MKIRAGALIRQHTKDNPPYQVDTTRYKRWDQKNDMYSRPSWDDTLAGSMMEEGRANAVRKLKPDSTGLTRLEFALYTAAWTVGTTLGSISGTIGAAHRGLYSGLQ